jgi:ABC-2 type transport system permease protein
MIFTIVKRELKSFYSSPVSFIVMGLFMALTGYIFYSLLISFVENTQHIPGQYRSGLDFVNHVTIQLFTNINLFLVIFCPVLTMKIFADEKKEGILDLYFSSKVSDFELVLAKYIASLVKGGVLLVLTLIFPLILWSLKAPDFSFVYSGYLGLLLNVSFYISIGFLASAVTANSVVAAVISYVAILFFWMISWASQISSNYLYATIFKYLSVVKHFEVIAKGSLTLSSFTYFFTLNLFLLIATKVVLGARKW